MPSHRFDPNIIATFPAGTVIKAYRVSSQRDGAPIGKVLGQATVTTAGATLTTPASTSRGYDSGTYVAHALVNGQHTYVHWVEP